MILDSAYFLECLESGVTGDSLIVEKAQSPVLLWLDSC